MSHHIIIVGASVGGTIAAITLQAAGIETTLIERELHKAKPCGGAVPPAAFHEFDLPRHLIDRTIHKCRIISPSGQETIIPVVGTVPSDDDYVAMVRREIFDHFLRVRAQEHGATLIEGTVLRMYITRDHVEVVYRDSQGHEHMQRADAIIGADGAYSTTAKFLGLRNLPDSVAIQERIALPPDGMAHWHNTADMYLGHDISPDFYGWVFPKSDHVTVGIGTKRAHAKDAHRLLNTLKQRLGNALDGAEVLLRESHSLPMTPRRQIAFERALLIGDAAGLVARTSGEGIYWAMKSGQLAANVLATCLDAPTLANLRRYEREWWKHHRAMYTFLHMLQIWGYGNERQMHVFADMCSNKDVQRLTFDSYMHKKMQPAPMLAQLRMTYDIMRSQARAYLNL